MKPRQYCFSLFITVTFLLLSGCASKNPLPVDHNYSSALINVPFISPRSELCGSTSIEMLSLYWQSRSSYTPRLSLRELNERTWIPDKGGTLQIELVAAARANALLAYPLEPSLDALFRELDANHPVIVLVNRGFSWYPLWHYAPVTGYDAKTQTIWMHFFDTPNEAMPLGTFAALWQRSGNWGILLLPPEQLPASAWAKKFLFCAYDFEKIGMTKEAITAYKTALIRWPEDIGILFALGNAYYNSRQIAHAEQIYRKILDIDSTYPFALNNLADLLYRTNRSEEALRLLDTLDTNVSQDTQIQSMINATRQEIFSSKHK